MFDWIKRTWDRFEAWLASRWPRAKTKLIALVGLLSSAAFIAQEFFQGLPGLDLFITPRTIAITNLILFILVFWLRNISNRVVARELVQVSEQIEEIKPVEAEQLKKASEVIRTSEKD